MRDGSILIARCHQYDCEVVMDAGVRAAAVTAVEVAMAVVVMAVEVAMAASAQLVRTQGGGTRFSLHTDVLRMLFSTDPPFTRDPQGRSRGRQTCSDGPRIPG